MSAYPLFTILTLAEIIYKSSKKRKKKKQLKINTLSGDVEIRNLIDKVLNLNKIIKENDFKSNENKLEIYKLKKPSLKEIKKPIKDEFETSIQYNLRYQNYKRELEFNKNQFTEKLQQFENKKLALLDSYTFDRDTLIHQLEVKKNILLNEQEKVLNEKVNIYENSKIFPGITISDYDADKELFKILINKLNCDLKFNINKAREFKKSFDLFEKKIQVQFVLIDSILFYKYLSIEIKVIRKENYKIILPENLSKLPISSYKNV